MQLRRALWSLLKQQISKLEERNLKFLKAIVPRINSDSTYEEVILEAAKFECIIVPIESQAVRRGLKFLGHIGRMNPNSIQI